MLDRDQGQPGQVQCIEATLESVESAQLVGEVLFALWVHCAVPFRFERNATLR